MKRRVALMVFRAACVLLAIVPLSAQETKPPADDPNAPKVLNDLTTRFRLHEKYNVGDISKRSQGEIGQYRVGFKETFRTTEEQAQGAPLRGEFGRRAIYDERPSKVSTLDARRVTDVVRRYVGVQMIPDTARKIADAPKPFENLTIWLHTLPGDPSEIIVLTPGRQLMDGEYMVAADQIFMPDLAYVLPELPVRIGESWSVARTGASTLVGLEVAQGTLTGKLLSMRVDPVDLKHTAVIDVQGTVTTKAPAAASSRDVGEGPVHAELEFTFTAPPAPARGAADDEAAKRSSVIDAVGWIERISLAQELVGPVPRSEGRLKRTTSREFILERRVGSVDGPRLEVPKEVPVATIENSWVTYLDPGDRFHFRHPQNMHQEQPPEGVTVYMLRPRNGGADFIFLTLAPRADLSPDAFQKEVRQELADKPVQIVPGQSEWLPEADWPKMKVHRDTFAMMPKGQNTVGGPRFHEFDYILQTGREQGLQVRATTNSDPPTGFRQEVEAMLKTFEFGSPAPVAPEAAAPATP